MNGLGTGPSPSAVIWLRDVIRSNPATFRKVGPGEAASNRLSAVFERPTGPGTSRSRSGVVARALDRVRRERLRRPLSGLGWGSRTSRPPWRTNAWLSSSRVRVGATSAVFIRACDGTASEV
ncbi:hypothetical protein ABZV93_18220 [Actinopolymorpha sp. NPDC004070]|uniref:hypothetical protein n=1 Tax=Actinopolymorpha sp. NPDC004070 TaxID=3154548 RepID=UPI0033A4A307